MTSHKSLNKKKGSAFSFRSGIRSAFLPAGLMFIVLTLLTAVITLTNFISRKNALRYDSVGSGTVASLSDTIKYSIFSDSLFMPVIALIAVGLLSIAAGIIVFRFTADKRTVNVYYSLGIKRRALYLARYFSGAVMLCAAVAIPMILVYFVNLAFIGPSMNLSAALLYTYMGLSLFSLVCYTVTAAVFCCVGTVFEGVGFSVAVLASPSALILAFEGFATNFLQGNPFTVRATAIGGNIISEETGSMVFQFARYNPLLFFYNGLRTYASASVNKDTVFLANESKWLFPDMLSLVPWFFVAVIACVLGLFLFKIRKAENCGFTGTNKVLNNLLLFEIGILAFSVLSQLGTLMMFLVGCGVFLVVYFVLEMLFKRSFKAVLKSCYKYPAHIAAFAIVFLVFYSGGFGYSSKVPVASDVTSCYISVPVSQSVLGTPNNNGKMSNGSFLTDMLYVQTALGELTDEKDIAQVLSVHKALIDDSEKTGQVSGSKVGIYISYKLKNGKTLTRYFTDVSTETIISALNFFDSSFSENRLDAVLNKTDTLDIDKNSYFGNSLLSSLTYDTCAVNTALSNTNEQYRLNLTAQQFTALKAAIAKDLISMTGTDFYFGEAKQLGAIIFAPKNNLPEFTAVNPDDDFSVCVYGKYLFDESMYYDGDASYSVIIDERMSETLSLLKSIGCGDCFVSRVAIKSVSFVKCNYEEMFGSWGNLSYEFNADINIITNRYYSPESNYVGENTQIAPERLSELTSLMKLHAYTCNTGYLCYVKYSDGNTAVLYLPESKAPSYVTDFSYTPYSDSDYYY